MAPAESRDTSGSRGGQKRPRYSLLLRVLAPLVVVGWFVATGAALLFIQPLSTAGSRNIIGAAIGRSSPAVKAAIVDAKRFDFPLATQLVIVQHREQGLSLPAQLNTLARSAELDAHALPGYQAIEGALPIADDGHVLKALSGHVKTALTFLLVSPRLSFRQTTLLAQSYAHRYLNGPGDGLVGVTGPYPANYYQGNAISSSLTLVELLSIGILLLVVGVTFRSIVAPLIALLSAGIAYEVSQRILSLATTHLGIAVPQELDPIIVVLLLGLMTDYCVFYFTSFRRQLAEGGARKVAGPLSFSEVTPIVFVAGCTVASGVALIVIARLNLFSQLGPGLAITVAVTMLVAVSFVPSLVTLLGKYALWPKMVAVPVSKRRQRFQRLVTHPFAGGALAALFLAVLIWLSLPLGKLSLGINLIGDLNPANQAARAAQVAGRAFTPGVVAPTEVLVSGSGAADQAKLVRLQDAISSSTGVAAVIGPADNILHVPEGVFVSRVGPTARYLVVFRQAPFDSAAIADFNHLRTTMPRLVRSAGLAGSAVSYTGYTALSAEITRPALSDLLWVPLAVVAVDFLLLAFFLRALLAPLVLVAASSLVVASSLGLTMMLFPSVAGGGGFTFYVPFATEVLLLSFGTDYNLFLTGEIWRFARRQRFREAVARGGAIASAGINVAGATLAMSFAVLVVVPLRSFTELGVAIFAGLFIDTFIVRFFLVPGVLSLLGTKAGWPGHRLDVPARPRDERSGEATPVAGHEEGQVTRSA